MSSARRFAAGSPGQPLATSCQTWLRAEIKSHGLREVMDLVDFPRATVANAAGGCGLRTATKIVMEQRIAAIQKNRAASESQS